MLLRSRAKFYLYSDKSVYSFNVIALRESKMDYVNTTIKVINTGVQNHKLFLGYGKLSQT